MAMQSSQRRPVFQNVPSADSQSFVSHVPEKYLPHQQQSQDLTPARQQKNEPKPTREEISQRAYEIYSASGGRQGQSEQNWAQAEQELKNDPNTSSSTQSESQP